MRQLPTLLFLILALSATIACGGGGSGSEATTVGGGSSNVAASYTPDAQNPGANTVYTTGTPGSGSNASLLTLHVLVNNTSDVFGASFDVVFDPSRVQFLNWSPGQLLEFGGQTVSYQVAAVEPGRVVLGMARTSTEIGVTSQGATTLVNLTLRATSAGASSVSFERAALLDSQNPPQSMSGIAFFGGTLAAN